MPSEELEGCALAGWSGVAYRLFPTRFPPVNVYEGLVANDRYDEVFAIESLTNPRLRSLERLQRTTGEGSADPRLQNWNLAPFAYGNPEGTTFFGEKPPCLELAFERQTALAVSVARRQAFMAATRQAAIGLDVRMLCTPVKGLFWDLRALGDAPAGLGAAERRRIGSMMPEGAQGIIYRPPERALGACVAVVDGMALGRSEQSMHFRYLWDGSSISTLYAFGRTGATIPAAALAGMDDVLAAA